jgi:hypothetical protein
MGDLAENNTVFAFLPIFFHGLGTAKILIETSKNSREQAFHFIDEVPDIGRLDINLPNIIDENWAKGKVCVDKPARRNNLKFC